MQQLDDRILEHLNEEPWSSPSVMESLPRLRGSKRRIRERCEVLASAGLIAPVHGEMYEITTWGMRYLEGKIDARHQPRPNPRVLRG